MIKNLVLGSDGFVGKQSCQFLKSHGEEVIPFDLKLSSSQAARTTVLDLSSVDRVYSLAWEVSGAKYLYREDRQLRQLEWNWKLMLNVMLQQENAGRPGSKRLGHSAEDLKRVS
jgi:hypothetical protein